MKKNTIKLDKALSFDKETIAKLNDDQLGTLEGGQAGSNTCNTAPAPAVADDGTTVNSCLACSCN
jgi:hypothetical protein